ncbi:Protein asteroid-like protein 1 [Nibea albiflora]|uniref:Protein asteroid-like protein 1 n=1 Tax=Nibea albiflora TaxID=240163 RepID=A0ACB7F9I2_NIBAL|nr:Protein asteroid-like protein 1 [Nibea albiflora]
MGVRGLVTFIEKHPRIYRDVRFRMSRLVIDGANLLHLLYFDSGVYLIKTGVYLIKTGVYLLNTGLDQNHGGEYAAFEELIERFITTLRNCGVSPFVVLDGGSDYTDKKLDTVTQRAVDRIEKAHRAAWDDSEQNILPQLAKLMFTQTLARLEVPMAQCYAEADQEIAALANEWRCPVLSNDSDFYIFDLPAGFLPTSHFQWKAVEQSGSQSYIPCKNYNTRSFCILINIEHELLPTFAALAGNDYVKLQKMERPIRWTQFCPASDGIPSRLEGLLCWLRDFHQPEKALEAALGLMGELGTKRKKEVLQSLYLGMEEYKLPSSTLMRFFVDGVAPPFPTFEGVKGLIPDWTRLPLTQARLTSDILDVLLLQRNDLSIPVDHGDMASINLTSRPLRQVMYGLLLGKRRQLVNERDRDGLQLKVIPVQPAVRGVARQLTLESLDQAESSQRLQVLLDALGVTEASLSRLPPQLRLPVAVTCYWLQRAQPRPDQRLLKALLLGLSNGDALRQRAASQIQNKCYKQKLDVSVVHAFNQWQGCLKDSVYLNQLLGRPLEEPQIARLYEGTLVHDLVHQMRTGRKLKHFLKSDRSSVRQYSAMMAVINQFHCQEASTSHNQKTVTPPRRQPLEDLTANLQQLFLLCEDEMEVSSTVSVQEDLHLEDLLSVKTRYRAKKRNNRSKNPEVARKEERRGDVVLW